MTITTAPGTPSGDGVPGAVTLRTPAQAAAWLGEDEDRLTTWREHHEGPAYVRISRRTIRYQPSELGPFRNLARRPG